MKITSWVCNGRAVSALQTPGCRITLALRNVAFPEALLCLFLAYQLMGRFCFTPSQSDVGSVRAGPEEVTRVIPGLEHLCCGDRMRNLGVFSPEKRRVKGDFIVDFQYLKGVYKRG